MVFIVLRLFLQLSNKYSLVVEYIIIYILYINITLFNFIR